ncbi:hypothetical protein C2E20_7676 [Micractinium conductrix]|uniref:GmrSD restriction endonucleases C-terminal domain-containing protein n=1 Tax=Micractinium conductrix TaxID=554055 RepID=A0A2P6V3V9_9CHLO|nr:hypothetical protein C2E20_7676 [Micractinium conductrix]|eukprot:PSC68764.1 hypothetical protein C2E20_7676 [Micractinium conductrix]
MQAIRRQLDEMEEEQCIRLAKYILLKVYSEMEYADFERAASEAVSAEVRYLLRVLGRFGEKRDEWRAVVLAMLLLHRNNRFSDESLLVGLACAERLMWCSMLCKWTLKKRRERWLQVLHELGCVRGSTYALLRSRTSIVQRPPALDLDAEEKAAALAALDGPVYKELTKAATRQLLMRLNEFVLKASGSTYVLYEEDKSAPLTVEHVLPQVAADPEGGREAAVGEWGAFGPKEERVRWVNRLANLVLLSGKTNSQAGKLAFQEKKERYFKPNKVMAKSFTNIPLTDMMMHAEEWTPAVLEDRQQSLLGLAKNCWQLY